MTVVSRLAMGEVRVVSVDSREIWNDTGIDIEAHASYALAATGEWWDASYRSGPEGIEGGFTHRLAAPFRRITAARWFCLVCELHCGCALDAGNESAVIIVGRGTQMTLPYDGRLFAYANDVLMPLFPNALYSNNRGCVDLRVARTS